MITMKTKGGLSHGGLYLVVRDDGQLRALIDEEVAMSIPDIRQIIKAVGKALDSALPNGMAVYMRFKRGPGYKTNGLLARTAGQRLAIQQEQR